MPSSNSYVGYDLNLLATAPPPTNGNVPSSLQYNPVPPKSSDLESGRPQFYPYTSNATVGNVEPKVVPTTFIPTNTSPPAGKKPFFRTTKGIIIIVIVALVLLAAIIGGAVAGTLANKDKAMPVVQSDYTGTTSGDPVATSAIRITTTSPYPTTSVVRITTTIGFASTA